MGYRELDAGGHPCDGLASHPGGIIEIFLVASCYGNCGKLCHNWLVCRLYFTIHVLKGFCEYEMTDL